MPNQSDNAWRIKRPIVFDADSYRNSYSDLSDLSDDELEAHYFAHGRFEGRIGTPYATREMLIGLAKGARSILEIGPGHKPCFSGKGVKYFDVLDADELRQRALRHTDEAIDQSPSHVDFVNKDGDVSSVNEKFELVFSSHNLEHQTDLIKHLNDVHGLLEPGGAFIGLMPDRRFCFDRDIPGSSVGDVLEAFLERRRRHRKADIIDQYGIQSHNDARRHWHASDLRAPHINIEQIKIGIEQSKTHEYVDVHAWRFAFFEFEASVKTCIDLGYVHFQDFSVFPTPYLSNEYGFIFYM